MKRIEKLCAIAALCLSAFIVSTPAKADLLAASGSQSFVQLNPLRNGLSAITLSWPIAQQTEQKFSALQAALAAVLTAGTTELSPFDAATYRNLNGISFNVSREGANLLLTTTAPTSTFPLALEHLQKTLNNPVFPKDKYKRELVRLLPNIVTKTRRPQDVIFTIVKHLELPDQPVDVKIEDMEFRFGRPKQVIMRSGVPEHKPLADAVLISLETPPRRIFGQLFEKLSFAQVANSIDMTSKQPFTLPKGVIHLPDPHASEMMIMLLKAQTFEDEPQQIAANILMNYIGAHQGSEMFRIIRQELRAAYSPRSYFEIGGKNKALMAMSATVAAEEWPTILDRIQKIYSETRTGELSTTGLGNVRTRLIRQYNNSFATDPVWGVRNLLREFPFQVEGEIRIPLFTALNNSDLVDITENAGSHLAAIDEYLVVLVGGGPSPSEELKANGYCELSKNQPLVHCLNELANATN